MSKYGIEVPMLWPDLEPYLTNDNLPTIAQAERALLIQEEYNQRSGTYTGPWVWSLLRNIPSPVLSTRPLWTAEYNEKPTLEDVTLYGGWTQAMGHQYSTRGEIDWNVFDQSVVI